MKAGSKLEQALVEGRFAVTSEIGPPKSVDAEVVRRKARLLRDHALAANITDNPTGVVRMASIACGLMALQEGMEPIVQVTCRDRNRMAIQSDLLGAAAMGIKNVLCLTGDHPSLGNHPQSKPVFDLDSLQLTQMVRNMRDEKQFQNGEELNPEPRLFVGAVENPFGHPLQFRSVRLAKKVNAGADFIQTQLIFNIKRFREWMQEVRDRGIHERVYILAGVGPIRSAGAARFMRDRVPGMDVPEEVVQRMAGVERNEARKEGIKICVETIQELREMEGIAGIHIMALEWEEAVGEIVETAGLKPLPMRLAASVSPER
ncbi:MAG: 5,10-methylenetetrahydrofolate reductase [Dehalococcoidia bacterium]|nr:5,10-methylenetetrahydrofolate reductase [Dehalococcoidia bacterium]